MTKLFIAGHSDSTAQHLPEGALPWTERLRSWIESETGTPCELQGVLFFPMGARAADRLITAVEDAQPDILVLPFSAYVCTFTTVEESVRQRFGTRAQQFYLRGEKRFAASTTAAPLKPVNYSGRKFVRAVLGTRALATTEQTIAIYEEILQRLARMEDLQVVTVADARFSEETQKRNPKMHREIDRMQARLFPMVERHHFLLADLEGALRKAPDRSVFYQSDGIHTTLAFHDVFFEVLKDTIAPTLTTRRSSARA